MLIAVVSHFLCHASHYHSFGTGFFKRYRTTYTTHIVFKTVINEGLMKCAVQKENPEDVMLDRCD